MKINDMQLLDHLLRESYSTFNAIGNVNKYQIVFKMNGELFTGDFFRRDITGNATKIYFEDGKARLAPVLENDFRLQNEFIQSIMTQGNTNSAILGLYRTKEIFLKHLVDYVKDAHCEAIAQPVIYNLRSYENKKFELEFYLVSDSDDFEVVSLLTK